MWYSGCDTCVQQWSKLVFKGKTLEIFISVTDKVHKTDNEPFVICDYGCGDGGVTLPLVKECIGNDFI